jgi:hypothetical protein
MKIPSAMIASMYEIDSMVSDKLEVATSVSLVSFYYDVICGEGYENVILSNLISGLGDSFKYYLKHDSPTYLKQIRDYFQDIYDIYANYILNETEIYLEDSELIDFYSKLLALQMKIPHQEVS